MTGETIIKVISLSGSNLSLFQEFFDAIKGEIV